MTKLEPARVPVNSGALTKDELDDFAARYDALAEDMRTTREWYDAQIADQITRALGPFVRPPEEPWRPVAVTRTPYQEMILCERWGIKP